MALFSENCLTGVKEGAVLAARLSTKRLLSVLELAKIICIQNTVAKFTIASP